MMRSWETKDLFIHYTTCMNNLNSNYWYNRFILWPMPLILSCTYVSASVYCISSYCSYHFIWYASVCILFVFLLFVLCCLLVKLACCPVMPIKILNHELFIQHNGNKIHKYVVSPSDIPCVSIAVWDGDWFGIKVTSNHEYVDWAVVAATLWFIYWQGMVLCK